ncbi:hypothetical protein NBRC10513v2_005299 [Rhodotorula toruloides]
MLLRSLFLLALAALPLSSAGPSCAHHALHTRRHRTLGRLNVTAHEQHLEARGLKVVKSCAVPGSAAITMDDGPLYGGPAATLIQQLGGHASFFVNGNLNGSCIYDQADLLRQYYDAGHLIAAHTWSHTDITTMTPAQLNAELDLLETALQKILGIKPKYFRPPYGAFDEASLGILEARGYTVILPIGRRTVVLWDFDSGDWNPTVEPEQSFALSTTLNYPQPALMIFHENREETATEVLPHVAPMLVSEGYKLKTVAECLRASPYQSVGKPSARDATWTCEGTPGTVW